MLRINEWNNESFFYDAQQHVSTTIDVFVMIVFLKFLLYSIGQIYIFSSYSITILHT